MNPSTALARVVVDELVRNGLTHFVLASGSRSAPLAFALADAESRGTLRLHVRVDERSAAFTALGIARSSGVPAAVVTTSGTAVANLHPAVLEAHHGAVPLLLLTADRPEELRGVGANQTTDQVGIFGGSVRSFHDLSASDGRSGQVPHWRSSICRAFLAASGAVSGDPGPVHVNVAFRDPLVPAGDEVWVESLDGRPDGHPWTGAAARVADPLVCSGLDDESETLVVLGDTTEQLASAAWRIAGKRNWPVVAEPQWRGGGAGVACSPLVAGAASWVDRNAPQRILVVGRPTLSRQIARLVGGGVAPVDVLTSGPRWSDAAHAARRVYVAAAAYPSAPNDPTGSLDADAGRLRSAWTEAGERARIVVDRILDEDQAGLPAPSGITATRAVLRALPRDAVLFLGSSSVIRDVDLLGEQLPRPVLTNRGVGGIDGTVSSAVGVALADSTRLRPSYAIMGDLAFLHDANGLVIGPPEPRPDLCIVVLNDEGGGIFALLEQGAPEHSGVFERVFGTPHGVDIAALCAATRTSHQRVEIEKLDAALVPQPGLRVIEVRVDRHHHRELHARLRSEVAAALT
ncbi:MAG TPA: 2-succinyl-5-enolpyruvyl-6-hydroxy-3-cyclohexene-1-carboxylic-acid synthase [Jiangellaceae bacterium]